MTLTQEELFMLRVKSLPDGLTTIHVFKHDGKLYFWTVGDTKKTESGIMSSWQTIQKQ